VCLAFGRLGAIDPGRIGLSSTEKSHVDGRSKPLVFVYAGDAVCFKIFIYVKFF